MSWDPLILLRSDTPRPEEVIAPVLAAFPAQAPKLSLPSGNWRLSPYPPLLPLLRDRLRNHSPEALDAFLSKTQTYPLHRPVFQSYYRYRGTSRTENLIYEEAPYERSRLFQSLWNQWREVYGPGPGIITIPWLSRMPSSTLEFLLWWKDRPDRGEWTFAVAYHPQEVELREGVWFELWQALVAQAGISPPRVRQLGGGGTEGNSLALALPETTQAILEDLFNFLCFKDLTEILDIQIRQGSLSGPREIFARDLLGRSYLLMEEVEKGSMEFYKVMELAQEQDKPRQLWAAHRMAALVQYKKDHTEGSLRFCFQSLEWTERTGDLAGTFESLFLILLNDARENHLNQDQWETHFRQYLDLGQKLKMPNHLAYWLSRPDRLDPLERQEEVDQYQDQAIQLALELDNEMRLAAAYHTKGYSLLLRGQEDQVPHFYRRSETLKKRLGNPLETAYVQNGLGYFYHQIGDQARAQKYLFLCLDKAREAGDYHEVAMALCNLAILYVYCGWPDLALQYLGELRTLMRGLHISSLSYHSAFEIDGLTALAHLRSGREVMFREYLDKMERSGGKSKESRTGGQLEENLLYLVLSAQDQGLRGHMDKAQVFMAQAWNHYTQYQSSLKHRRVFLEDEEDWLRSLIRGRRGQRPQRLDRPKRVPDFLSLRETARLTASHQYLQKKLEEVHLLTLLRGLQDQEAEAEGFLRSSLDLLRRNVHADLAFFARKDDAPSSWIQDSDAPDLSPITWEALRKLLAPDLAPGKNLHYCRQHLWPRNLPGQAWVVFPLKDPGGPEARLVLGIMKDERDFDEEDLSILDLAAAQISSKLETLNHNRQIQEKNLELEASNRELQASLEALKKTQAQLIAQEKMAVLGTLVAGIAHEINTPVGISVTTASYLGSEAAKLLQEQKENRMTRARFEKFLLDLKESTGLLGSNLERAAALIRSFKQVSVDQTIEEERQFHLGRYLQDLLTSLGPQLKRKEIQVHIHCPEDLTIWSFPGVISQIFTNLCINSFHHGFKDRDRGTITIQAQVESPNLVLTYQDDGRGMSEEDRAHHFEPFYTTMRSEGGTGLGSYIIYNLVTQRLRGDISLWTQTSKGVHYRLTLPLKIPF